MIITSKPKAKKPNVASLDANKKPRKPRTKKLHASVDASGVGAEVMGAVVLPAPVPTLLDTLNSAAQGFVTGPAGSGKSYLIRQQLELNPGWGLLTATTGVAARILGPGVTTIHSSLGFFNLESIQSHTCLRKNVARLREHYERIIIDEVSMLDARMFEPIAAACQKEDMKLILCGDFLQLAPVDDKHDNPPWIPPHWVFRSKQFEPFRANIMRLQTQYRHTDANFLQGMNLLRRGNGEAAIAHLKKAGVTFLESYKDFHWDFDGVTLTPTRKRKAKIDAHHYNQLPGEEVIFKTLRAGKQRAEWKDNIEDEVALKVGCRVMLLRNEDGARVWANGEMGVVLELVEETDTRRGYATVERDGDKAVLKIEMVNDDDSVWFNSFSSSGCQRIIVKPAKGWCKWMPLRRCYALTFHKAQGLTLAKVQVDLLPKFSGTPAMTYVAMSRARTPEGLTVFFSEELLAQRCKMSPHCEEWL